MSEIEARKEVEVVTNWIKQHHPNPFHVVPEATFDAKVSNLLKRTGEVNIVQQYFDLTSLVSLVYDTHTQFHITSDTPGFKRTIPMRFREFKDGIYIIAASEQYKSTLGSRVLKVNGTPIAEIIKALSHHAPADSDPRRQTYAEIFLYMPESYQYLGLIGADEKVVFELKDLSGATHQLEIEELWEKGYADFSWDTQNPFTPKELLSLHDYLNEKQPFYLRNLGTNYWYDFLDPENKYLYLQINQQFKMERGPSPIELHLNWAKELLENKTEVMIVDLRNNPGGTINIGNSIAALLSQIYFDHPTMRGVAVLIGRDTVSAGTVIASQLESSIRPIIMGQESGSSPNLFLDAKKTVLPFSKLQLEVSSDIFITTTESDARRFIMPDVFYSMSFEEYLKGEDNLLELAKKIDKPLRSQIYKGSSANRPWLRESQTVAPNH